MSVTQVDAALVAAEDYERTFVTYTMGPCAALLLERAKPRPGERVVDVASGTGAVARLAAQRVGVSGTIVAVDVSAAMLAVGQSLPAPGGAAIEWREGNALALPLPDASFDLALCQHGLQYFPDCTAALREMRRVLAPGGRVGLTVWRSLEYNPVSQLLWETVARRLGAPISVVARGFTRGNADELRSMVRTAGFHSVRVYTRALTVRQPRDGQLVARIVAAAGALVHTYAAMTADERSSLSEAVEREIGPALQRYVEGDQQIFPMALHIAVARA